MWCKGCGEVYVEMELYCKDCKKKQREQEQQRQSLSLDDRADTDTDA